MILLFLPLCGLWSLLLLFVWREVIGLRLPSHLLLESRYLFELSLAALTVELLFGRWHGWEEATVIILLSWHPVGHLAIL